MIGYPYNGTWPVYYAESWATTTCTITSGTSGTLTVSNAWVSYTSCELPSAEREIKIRELWIAPFRCFADLVPAKQQAMGQTLRRAPARKCIKDARRWKRRRFIQRLAA